MIRFNEQGIAVPEWMGPIDFYDEIIEQFRDTAYQCNEDGFGWIAKPVERAIRFGLIRTLTRWYVQPDRYEFI